MCDCTPSGLETLKRYEIGIESRWDLVKNLIPYKAPRNMANYCEEDILVVYVHKHFGGL